jgi:hypothetical protein
MSKVQVAGNASGTGIFTIASPNSNTDRTLTLPNATGTLLSSATTAGFPAGSVLQVVQGTANTEVSSSSGAWVTTGLAATITPTSSTSKILVLVTMPVANNATASSAFFSIYRNSTNLGVGPYSALGQSYGLSSVIFYNVAMDTLDSPATTSATTYTAYMQAYATQVVTAMINGVGGRIILLEIAA